MNDPTVTIITVSYNAALTIENTILSVINQTYSNVEYIVIDGGSTDGTIDVIKKYENRISYWISESDEGVYDAMNKGIKMAHGEWVNFMNCGDTFYNETVLEVLFKYPVNCKYVFLFGNTEFITRTSHCIVKYGDMYLHKYMPACHQSIFCRRVELEKKPFDTTYKIAADLNFFYCLKKEGREGKYIDITVSIYNAIDGISGNNEIRTLKEILKITSPFKISYYVKCLLMVGKVVLKKVYIKK